MTDFDFDEIDKAVTGALETDSSTPSTVPKIPSEPEQSRVENPITTDPVVEAPKAAPATRRSAGRFMDVVHPSSDMRTRMSGSSTPLSTAASTPTSFTPPIAKNDDTPEEATPTSQEESALDDLVGEWTKPIESPFLADAKVEKRPLGGFAPESDQALLDAPEEEFKLEAPDELLLEAEYPDPIDFAAQSTALSSENEDTALVETEESTPERAFEETSQVDVVENSDTADSENIEAPIPAPVQIEEEVPAGPASITQQYTEQPSANQESGSIYDTENYHQPLAHAGKKRSGAWAILWIFLLVVLGAGAGVAFYLYVLPML